MTPILPTIKATDMPITYDLETDIRYLQGIEKNKIENVKNALLLNANTVEEISFMMGVPIEEIERIKKDMELDTDSSDNQNN